MLDKSSFPEGYIAPFYKLYIILLKNDNIPSMEFILLIKMYLLPNGENKNGVTMILSIANWRRSLALSSVLLSMMVIPTQRISHHYIISLQLQTLHISIL
ncbi:hypothetical protein PPE_02828 [Paenibacillus polymyxa E681]|nr:hypothetical protein PPE_02828 [Paenibacillus polymyxa E681]